MSLGDELEKLHKLKKSGALHEAEFEEQKKILLSKNSGVENAPRESAPTVSVQNRQHDIIVGVSFILVMVLGAALAAFSYLTDIYIPYFEFGAIVVGNFFIGLLLEGSFHLEAYPLPASDKLNS